MSSERSLPPCERRPADLEAYFDGELSDSALEAESERHIQECRACRENLHALTALRTQVRLLPRQEAPPYLQEKVLTLLETPAAQLVHAEPLAPSRKLRWMIACGVPVLLLVGAVAGVFISEQHRSYSGIATLKEMDPFVEDHVAYVQAEAAKEEETTDPAQLESWLSARLEFAPRLPRWDWAQLRSGRPCSVAGERVALVRYAYGDQDLSLFIHPAASIAEEASPQRTKATVTHARGYKVALWKEDGLEYMLVAPGPARIDPDTLSGAG